MKKEYKEFVAAISRNLMAVSGLKEEQILFKEKGEGIAETGDRLFIELAAQEDSRQVCALYIRELYERYLGGESIADLTTKILNEIAKTGHEEFVKKTRNIHDYEKIRGDLFVRLLNVDKNRNDLKHAVYRTVGDIALVLYLYVMETDSCVTSLKIRQEYLELWKKEEDELLTEALANTMRMAPPRIYCWEKLIFDEDYQGEAFMDPEHGEEFKLKKGSYGNCLSTSRRVNGAVAAFLPGVAERLADMFGQDLYLVFTSVHEVMVHDASQVYPEDLEEVLRETIQKATPEADYLTSRIYRYCRSTGTVICVSDDN